MVEAVISSSRAEPGSATIRTAPSARIRTVAGMGVCVRGLTRRITWWAGKRESRDMA